jgi:hypothetical protein
MEMTHLQDCQIHGHAIALMPRRPQASEIVERRPKSEERVNKDASDGFFVGQADGVGRVGCGAHGAATDEITQLSRDTRGMPMPSARFGSLKRREFFFDLRGDSGPRMG